MKYVTKIFLRYTALWAGLMVCYLIGLPVLAVFCLAFVVGAWLAH